MNEEVKAQIAEMVQGYRTKEQIMAEMHIDEATLVKYCDELAYEQKIFTIDYRRVLGRGYAGPRPTQETAICPHCGAEILRKFPVCKNCGRDVGTPIEIYGPNGAHRYEDKTKRTLEKLVAVGYIFCVLTVCGPLILGIVPFVIGIVILIKGKVGHGIAQILIVTLLVSIRSAFASLTPGV